MSVEALLLGSMMGLGLWLLASLAWSSRRPVTMTERIAPYLLDVSARAREIHNPPVDDPLMIAGKVIAPDIAVFITRVDRLLGGRKSQKLVYQQSGRVEPFEQFRHRRAFSAVVAALVGALAGAGVAIVLALPVLMTGVAGFLAGAMITLVWQDYQLTRDVKRRAAGITEEFPTIIELLGLALAAGDSLPRALMRVTKRAPGELGREWARVMLMVDLGAPLAESLRASAVRIDSVQVRAFVEHLAQALERGAPLAEVVAAHSVDAKADFSRGLVEKAGKAEVRMLVPMVLLILPVTVIFAVYPGLQALEFGF